MADAVDLYGCSHAGTSMVVWVLNVHLQHLGQWGCSHHRASDDAEAERRAVSKVDIVDIVYLRTPSFASGTEALEVDDDLR